MEYFTMKVRAGEEEGLQVWCVSHGYARPADGEKVYPSRQNAYVARDRLQESISWQDCKVTIRVELKDLEPVMSHVEKLRGVEPLVCLPSRLPYSEDAFKKGKLPIVDVVFRYMCCPKDFTVLGPDRWRQSFMTYEELVEWLKELDATFPVVQSSQIEG